MDGDRSYVLFVGSILQIFEVDCGKIFVGAPPNAGRIAAHASSES
jgi:hypothetical protein